MSLVAKIIDTKNQSAWFDFKGAKFKIKNIKTPMYLIANDRVSDRIVTDGFNLEMVNEHSKRFLELHQEAIATFLIEDWQGVSFAEVVDGEPVVTEVQYNAENAKKLLSMGDMGFEITAFIETKAKELQAKIDKEHYDILGKLDSSTNGQSTEATKQQKDTQESK